MENEADGLCLVGSDAFVFVLADLSLEVTDGLRSADGLGVTDGFAEADYMILGVWSPLVCGGGVLIFLLDLDMDCLLDDTTSSSSFLASLKMEG